MSLSDQNPGTSLGTGPGASFWRSAPRPGSIRRRRAARRRAQQDRQHGRTVALRWALVLAAACGFWVWTQLREPASPVATLVAAWLPAAETVEVPVFAPRAMPVCGLVRRNCVVDGDTLWLDGEKIRLESIDAPEIEGACLRERQLAQRAKTRLAELVDRKPLSVTRNGTDRYGRTLALVAAADRDVGSVLIQENLARRWTGLRRPWC